MPNLIKAAKEFGNPEIEDAHNGGKVAIISANDTGDLVYLHDREDGDDLELVIELDGGISFAEPWTDETAMHIYPDAREFLASEAAGRNLSLGNYLQTH